MSFLSLNTKENIPISSTVIGRYLPWILGIMVLFVILIVEVYFIFGATVNKWEENVQGTLTIQIPYTTQESASNTNYQQQVDEIFAILSNIDAIQQVQVVKDETLLGMIEPWFGKLDDATLLPIPKLMEVILKPDAEIDIGIIEHDLQAIHPDVQINDHSAWLKPTLSFFHSIQFFSIFLIILIALASVFTIILAVKMGVVANIQTIEILHLMGAEDYYIAREFNNQTNKMGLKAGLFGVIAALIISALIYWIGILNFENQGFIKPVFSYWLIPVYIITPFVTAIMAVMVSNLSVRFSLAKLFRHGI